MVKAKAVQKLFFFNAAPAAPLPLPHPVATHLYFQLAGDTVTFALLQDVVLGRREPRNFRYAP
jgi:hypothetical protein